MILLILSRLAGSHGFWIALFLGAFTAMLFYARAMTTERDQALAAMGVAKKEIAAITAQKNNAIMALEKARKEDAERDQFSQKTKEEIQNAPDGRPLSPSQRRVAFRLRDRFHGGSRP